MGTRTLINPLRKHWRLNPDIDFLNHGSFGATPNVVLEKQRQWIDQLERDPIEFLAPERTLLPKLDQARQVIADLVAADVRNIAFVRNATEGVNAILRSFPFAPGDEVVVTNHGYNACNNAVRFAATRSGATTKIAEIPFPLESPEQVIDAIGQSITSQTRLLLIDHVTSPTGLIFPVKDIVEFAHRHNVRVMVDGAHAPGMVSVDLGELGADYYTANHHKWLCAPKTSGFLYVAPQWQSEVRPVTISHGANTDSYGQSKFLGEFNWVGTHDPTPVLSVPAAIDFISTLHPGGLIQLYQANRSLALIGRDKILDALDLAAPAPAQMIASLASVPIPSDGPTSTAEMKSLQRRLYDKHRIEVPVFRFNDNLHCLRISAQAYNHVDQYERLANALREELA